MGDPGLPIIVGVLAVPVCVLLFVLGLAIMGRRWTTAGTGTPIGAEFAPAGAPPGTGHPAIGAGGPSAPAARHATPAADAYGPSAMDAYGLPLTGAYGPPAPAARHATPPAAPCGPPVGPGSYGRAASAERLAPSEDAPSGRAPSGRPAYGQAPYGHPVYGHGGADEPAGWAPYVPSARPAPESSRATPRSVRPPEPPAYGPSDRRGWDEADQRWYRPADRWDHGGPHRPAADRPDRETEPPQGFTYGPYA